MMKTIGLPASITQYLLNPPNIPKFFWSCTYLASILKKKHKLPVASAHT